MAPFGFHDIQWVSEQIQRFEGEKEVSEILGEKTHTLIQPEFVQSTKQTVLITWLETRTPL